MFHVSLYWYLGIWQVNCFFQLYTLAFIAKYFFSCKVS
jgi:hypothetical protein